MLLVSEGGVAAQLGYDKFLPLMPIQRRDTNMMETFQTQWYPTDTSWSCPLRPKIHWLTLKWISNCLFNLRVWKWSRAPQICHLLLLPTAWRLVHVPVSSQTDPGGVIFVNLVDTWKFLEVSRHLRWVVKKKPYSWLIRSWNHWNGKAHLWVFMWGIYEMPKTWNALSRECLVLQYSYGV